MKGYQVGGFRSTIQITLRASCFSYQAALFTSCGLVGGSLLLSILTVRNGQQTVSSGMMVH